MSLCLICNKPISDGIYLSNGEMIDESCLNSIGNNEHNIKREIFELKNKIKSLKQEIERRSGLKFKIVSIFLKPDIDTSEIEKAILEIEKNIVHVSNELVPLKAKLSDIYDYFLTYPPDWDERRDQVAELFGAQCDKCGKIWNLHLHHIKPLSKGGNNKIENLQLLCEKCHSKKHGNRNFSAEFNNSETAFSKRVSNIRYAIQQGKRIKFGYKKYNENGYKQRTIIPKEIVNLQHQRDSGSTLCVRGYCELRKEDRTFALKRMRGLMIILE